MKKWGYDDFHMKQINLWVKDIEMTWKDMEMIDQATFYSVWAKFHR